MIVIQESYRGEEYTFFFSREGSVYLNIRGEGSVIQASLRGGECNLLLLNFCFEKYSRLLERKIKIYDANLESKF